MRKQWNFSTYDEMVKDITKTVLSEAVVEGKTLEEWVEILKDFLQSKQQGAE